MDGLRGRRSSELGMVKSCSPTDDVEYVAAAPPIRVLLCDDAEGFRALMRSSLAEDPSIEIVGEAADGLAGVEATAALQPDVVLLDMSMPRMGGLQAIPKMRRSAPGTSIIGLSSLSAARMAAPSIEIGAHTYLEKGTGLEDIRAAIHAAVDR
jgi:DNA-binding NarL/FixJ family response regulator